MKPRPRKHAHHHGKDPPPGFERAPRFFQNPLSPFASPFTPASIANGPGHSNVYPTRPLTCRNCGVLGHLYRDCMHPIMSFGMICYRTMPSSNEPEYLMIQRKDSLSFMEFIRGKYDLRNFRYIGSLLSSMTMQEREYLLLWNFDQLWNYVWYQANTTRVSNEFAEAKQKFDTLRAGYSLQIHGVDTIIHLGLLLHVYPSPFTEPEWGFPKGRRKLYEEDRDCATREFCEETGFSTTDLHSLKDTCCLEEVFYGTNNVLYRHVYYLARLDKQKDRIIVVDPDNIHQAREVRAVRWFTAAQVLANIRPHNEERRQLFLRARQVVEDYESGTLLKRGGSNILYLL